MDDVSQRAPRWRAAVTSKISLPVLYCVATAAVLITLSFSGASANRFLLAVMYAPFMQQVAVVVGALVAIVAIAAIVRIRRRTSCQTPLPVNASTHDIVISRLEARMDDLQSASRSIYWTILSVLVAGVLLVLFSGYLSSLDSLGFTLMQELDQQAAAIQQGLSQAAFDEQPSVASIQLVANQIDAINEQKSNVISAMMSRLEGPSGAQGGINIGSTVLRICIIGLIIFLVQILVQLLRYNSRLLAFYSARRDALLLSGNDTAKLEKLLELLAPTGLDFGKAPSHPMREAAHVLTGRMGGAGAASQAGTAQ